MTNEIKPPPLPAQNLKSGDGSARAKRVYWGGWATAGFGFLIAFVFLVAQTIVVLGAAIYAGVSFSDPVAIEALGYDADVLALATIASAVGVLALIALLIGMRSVSMNTYLGFRRPRWREIGCAIVITPLLGLGMDAVARMIHHGPPEFMVELAKSTTSPLLVAVGVALAAPIAEEVFFRGFLYRSWRVSRLGRFGACVMTSALWAAIHLQYGAFEITGIFVLGVVFTLMYEWSDSLWIPVGMHVLNNGLSLIQSNMLYG